MSPIHVTSDVAIESPTPPSSTMDGPSTDANANDEDDNISVTSTLDEEGDSDDEWPVNQVLAEGDFDGEINYLIEWQGYPLWSATWEPKENLKDDLMTEWAEAKETYKNGTAVPFKIREWKEACLKHFQDKIARHEARNRKRTLLGLEPTVHDSSLEEVAAGLRDGYPDDDEDTEQNESRSGSHDSAAQDIASLSPIPVENSQSKHAKDRRTKRNSTVNTIDQPSRTVRLPERVLPANDASKKRSLHVTASLAQKLSNATTSLSSKKMPPRVSQARPTPSQSKRRLATRSSSTAPSMNVFAGGEKRKESQRSLLQNASNTTREPRMILPRHRWMLQKASRDEEGVTAPAIIPSSLISLDNRAPIGAEENEPTGPRQGPGTTPDNAIMELDSPQTDESMAMPSPQNQPDRDEHSKRELDPNVEVGSEKKKKKKRFVHFHDDPVADEPMELAPDESLFVPQEPVAPGAREVFQVKIQNEPIIKLEDIDNTPSATNKAKAPRKMSLDDYNATPKTRLVSKICQLGPDASQSMELSFSTIPRDEHIAVISKFRENERLVFSHCCTAQNFRKQRDNSAGALVSMPLCKGYISSVPEPEKLATIADRLRVGSMGIICHGQDYCVLISPAQCEEWKEEHEGGPVNLTDSPLAYSIFKPSDSFSPAALAPVSEPSTASEQDGDAASEITTVERFLSSSFDDSLSPEIRNATKQAFFIASPPSAGQEELLLCRWLRNAYADCDIRTALHEGHWFSFMKLSHGVVILHEEALWTIRHFQGLADLLHAHTSHFHFFMFTRSLRLHSTLQSNSLQSPRVGDLRLSPIFLPGIAILITPSFLVSQPGQAYNFIKWYWQNYSKDSDTYRRGVVVVCAEIDKWVLELAVESAEKRNRLPKTTLAEQRTMRAYGSAIEARIKTSTLLQQLTTQSEDDTSGPLIFAPENIDGNDEQSLINWFGWWTVTNIDQFRKFTVLGSSEQSTTRLSRLVKQPAYQHTSVNDPDIVYEEFDRQQPWDTPNVQTPEITSHSAPLPTAKFKLIRNDDATSFTSLIAEIESEKREMAWSPIMLYKYPLAYWNSDMPFHFKDYASAFNSYQTWLEFFLRILRVRQTITNNTYAGLFYTIDGKWDPLSYPIDAKPSCRSWVAIYRPVKPHVRPWRSSELIIWDHDLHRRCSGKGEVYKEELIEAQQELIRIVREQSRDDEAGMPLKKVWVGGFPSGSGEGYSQPLDVTLDWLHSLVTENTKSWMPPTELKMATKGWKLLKLTKAPEVAMSEQSLDLPTKAPPAADAMDLDDVCEDDDMPVRKIIFHPPRGIPGRQRRNKCKNWLYQCSQEALSRGESNTFEYTFRPTMKWYGEQMEEGRGFEHIKVTSWETVFAQLKIDDPKRD